MSSVLDTEKKKLDELYTDVMSARESGNTDLAEILERTFSEAYKMYSNAVRIEADQFLKAQREGK